MAVKRKRRGEVSKRGVKRRGEERRGDKIRYT